MDIKPQNLLSVRVGRVVHRNFDVSGFLTTEEYEQFFQSNSTIDNLILPEHLKDSWIIVPTPYNTVYLGEIFSFYINCTNDSTQEPMINVSARIDVQIGNKKAVFLKEIKVERLEAKDSIDSVISYEIKEPQTHTITCTMCFDLAGRERESCRRYFPYPISKPIDVRTKFYYTECDEIYLEAIFNNLTNLPLQLKSVKFDSNNFDVTSLNWNLEEPQRWIFGEINRLNSGELRQYLFVLTPKKEIRYNTVMLKSINTIGKLDIVWHTGIGEKGHIQTSQLERTASTEKIKVYIEDIPTQTPLKKIFKTRLRIVNFSSKTVRPLVNFVNSNEQNILWLGLARKNLGQLEQSKSIDVLMNLYPVQKGLYSIPVIEITDLETNESVPYKDLASVDII